MAFDLDAVYRNLAPVVLGYLRARGAHEPEDLLGEVFVQVARDHERFRDGDDAEAVRRWVFTIARNRLIDDARRRRRRPQEDGSPITDRPAPSSPDDLDPELVTALLRLTDEQREVVALRYVAGFSLEEVARMTRRRVGAVKSLQHRAMENLRASVSPEPPGAL